MNTPSYSAMPTMRPEKPSFAGLVFKVAGVLAIPMLAGGIALYTRFITIEQDVAALKESMRENQSVHVQMADTLQNMRVTTATMELEVQGLRGSFDKIEGKLDAALSDMRQRAARGDR